VSKVLALLLALLPAPRQAAAAAPYGAGFYSTSEYMIGSVHVNIIFVESDGTIDAQTETWDAGRQAQVIGEIEAGMAWWAAREPRANLSFSYTVETITTGYEPITRSSADEGLWIAQIMGKKGYSDADYFDRVFRNNAARRDAAGTDWAFTFFVVDSNNDADGQFPDAYFAYAYLGGPFSVMTYDNNGYGPSNMDSVAAHETGHVFGALDEYASSGCSTSDRAGYLDKTNDNCENGGGSQFCIMRGQIDPYTFGAVCTHTREQLGWRDSDFDDIFDITDLPPTAALTPYSPDPTSDNTPTYSGVAHSTSVYPNANPNHWNTYLTPAQPAPGVSVLKIAGADYRIGAGAWQAASPSDGSFGGAVENFTFTAAPLADGTYTFYARARDNFGNYNAVIPSDPLTINTGNPTDIAYVYDGTGGDIDYVSSQSRLSANWGASSHPTGIARYYYAIGTSPGGTTVTGGWVDNSTSRSVTRSGLSLAENATYYFAVKAQSVGGGESGVSVSDGQAVDTTSPTARVLITTPLPARTGLLSLKLVVTEANVLDGTPQLSMRPGGAGTPVPFDLAHVTLSTWAASGWIETWTSTGTAPFVFSAYDGAGNRGSVITSGGSFVINSAVSGVSGGYAANSDSTSVTVPAGAWAGNLYVNISTPSAALLSSADYNTTDSVPVLGHNLSRDFSAFDGSWNPVSNFLSPVNIRVPYPDADNDGRLDGDYYPESRLWLYYLDPALNRWTRVADASANFADNYFQAPVSHFSVYAIRSTDPAATGLAGLKAYPNPRRMSEGSVSFSGFPLDAAGAEILIYNAAGERVRRLRRGAGIDSGNLGSWDGRNESGEKCASGLYLYEARTANYGSETGQVVILW
jgi:hypothetical protein